ncbi:MAG: ribonuclease catalytic domain-containing protein [Desulfobacterales bacterium]
MEPGNIVEYIESQKIVCAVVMEIKKQRVRLLSENNREVNLSTNRLTYKCHDRLKLTSGRNKLVESLKETACRRNNLIQKINIKDLWEVLNAEEEWIDLETMTSFCFQEPLTSDHGSAVIRAFFKDRTYFKFNHEKFLPLSEKQVEKMMRQERETERQNKIVRKGSEWLKNVQQNQPPPALTDETAKYADILKSCFVFGKASPDFTLGKAMLARADLDIGTKLFKILVKSGAWSPDENIELLRCEIPIDFPEDVLKTADLKAKNPDRDWQQGGRRDLTELTVFTIDGQSTLDYDDALSIEKDGDQYRIGIHIIDVGQFIKKGEPVDQEARNRTTSIYMPDLKIPMIPTVLSEGLCSLKAGEDRPAITVFARMTPFAEIIDVEILPSKINVSRQLSYSEANRIAETDEGIKTLYNLAGHFRSSRIKAGALQISLPEINLYFNDSGKIELTRIDRETPSRLLVSEMMILANQLMAKFLADNHMPAIFRSQPAPKSRILKNDDEGTLFQKCLQRKFLSRLVIGTVPEHHSGLGLPAYVTSTSPIRKYFDLVTQRQIRAVLGLEEPYSEEEIRTVIQTLENPMRNAGRIQFMRHRYWLLKILEEQTGQKKEAIVLDKRRDEYIVVLTEIMLECKLSQSSGTSLKPGDLIQITIQHADAQNDILSIFMG